MAAAIRNFARWIAWQISDPAPVREEAQARITVFSSGARPVRRGKSLSGSSSA